MQLCFGCQHPFPSTSLEYVDVSEELRRRLESLRALVARVQPTSSAGRQAVADMEEEVRIMLGVLRKELDDKAQRIRKLESQLSYVNKENEELRKRQVNAAVLQTAAPQKPKSARSSHSPMGPSNMLERFLSASGGAASPAPAGGRAPPPLPIMPSRAPIAASPSATVKPSDLVSAAIYCAVEALVVRCRAEVGVVWLRPQDSAGELLAPFIAGHSTANLRTSAPYRIPSSSLVGTVAATGIAVNLSPHEDAHCKARNAASAEHTSAKPKASFAHYLESNLSANLLVPLFSRYGEPSRTTIGVIQLIGSAAASFPFSERNELDAALASCLLTQTITAYLPTMMAEWTTRIYDHTIITTAASYDAKLDQRAAEKGTDDFDSTPMMIFRAGNCERTQPTNLAQTKVLKGDLLQSSQPLLFPVEGLKDVHRCLKSLEDNWASSVTLQTVLERKVEALTSQLDAARQGFISLSKGDALTPFRPKGPSASVRDAGRPAPQAAVTTVDIEDTENEVMQRIRKSTTAVFLTQSGELSTPARRKAEAKSGSQ